MLDKVSPRIQLLTLFVLTLLFGFIESITYSGFLFNHIYVYPPILYVGTIILLIKYKSVLSQDKSIKDVIRIISIILVGIYLALTIVEIFNYPNFVYSHWHVNLAAMPVFISYITTVTIFSEMSELSTKRIVINIAVISGLSMYCLANFPDLGHSLVNNWKEIIIFSNISYDEKMERRYGDFYGTMQFVKKITPENSIIAIPPQERPWLTEGNGALVRYFLYPRKLSHIEDVSLNDDPDYYLIARGSWDVDDDAKRGWPKQQITAVRFWCSNDGNSFKQYDRSYDPKVDHCLWGLIEVKND